MADPTRREMLKMAGAAGFTLAASMSAEAATVTTGSVTDADDKHLKNFSDQIMPRIMAPDPAAYHLLSDNQIIDNIRQATPQDGSDQEAFNGRKLQYVATQANIAIQYGAGKILTKIIKEFPELASGPVKRDGQSDFALAESLTKENYGSMSKYRPEGFQQPDMSLETLKAAIVGIMARDDLSRSGDLLAFPSQHMPLQDHSKFSPPTPLPLSTVLPKYKDNGRT